MTSESLENQCDDDNDDWDDDNLSDEMTDEELQHERAERIEKLGRAKDAMCFVLLAVREALTEARDDVKNIDAEGTRLVNLLSLFARAFNTFSLETPDGDASISSYA